MKNVIGWFSLGFICGLVLGILAAVMVSRAYQNEAIKLNHAEYNSTNGLWQWKTNSVIDAERY